KCWGENNNGQLGVGNSDSQGDNGNEMGDNLQAVNLGLDRTAVAVATGSTHACAILENGDLKCWGRNNEGQLGLGDDTDRGTFPEEMGENLPEVNLGTDRTAIAVALGVSHSCAILDNHML